MKYRCYEGETKRSDAGVCVSAELRVCVSRYSPSIDFEIFVSSLLLPCVQGHVQHMMVQCIFSSSLIYVFDVVVVVVILLRSVCRTVKKIRTHGYTHVHAFV